MDRIPESDWKKLRAMKNDALRFRCSRIFEKIEKLLSQREGKEHETYLKLWKLLREEDQDIAIMFNDMRRSTAINKLVAWKHQGVISAEQYSTFSDITRRTVDAAIKITWG